MIYLIGGSPRSGKTILAKKMARRLNCELILIDDIRKKEIKRLGRKDSVKYFPFEKIYKNNDDFFQKYSPKEILDCEIKEAKSIWPKIKAIISKSLKDNLQIVIEGVQLLPEFLEKYKTNSAVKIIILYKKNKKLLQEGFHKNKNKNDWLVIETKNKKTFRKAAETYSFYGNFFEKEARKHGFASENTEKDFKKTIDNLMVDIK